MSITLSSADLVRLEAAMATLLAPLCYQRLDDWRTAARKAVEPLLGADKSTFLLPLADQPLIQCEDADVAAYRSYQAYYINLDSGFHTRRRELGLEVHNGWMLYDPVQFPRTELYNDWGSPFRMFQPMGMSVELPPSPYPAMLSFHRERAGAPEAYEREMGILRLLLPAFKAGIFSCCQLAHRRAAFTALLDQMPGAVSVHDMSGRLVHENPALTRMLSSEPEAARIRAEVGCTAMLVAALARPTRSKSRPSVIPCRAERLVSTSGGQYIVRGGSEGPDPLPASGTVIVWVERVPSRRLAPDEVRARFGFTLREGQVAELMRDGRSNGQVARALGFTIHTARRHAEQVLSKLEVHSRAEAAAKLNAGRGVSEVRMSG